MHGRKNLSSSSRSGGSPPPATQSASSLPAFLTGQSDGVTIAIKVQPRASKNEISATAGPELRVKVTAPPVDAAANEALLRLLADKLDCSRGKVELIRGHTARHKVVKVHGLTATTVMAKLWAAGS
ncbi:MAG: DUF167 domain-containing protein [Verrucomicrobiota bacterium]